MEYCKTIKNLGITFDENFTFGPHNNLKIQKVYGVFNRIKHTTHTMPNYIKRDIVTAFVDPIMDYGNIVTYGWGVYGTNGDEGRILIADNDKVRYVFGVGCQDHITEYRDRLNTLRPDEWAKIQSATLIYKHLNGQTPAYLNDLFVTRNNNTRSNGQLVVNTPRTTFDMRSFPYSAILFWNSIPAEIVGVQNVEKFKNDLKIWMRENRE